MIKKSQGIILLSVLWIMIILTALAIGLSHRIYLISSLTKNKNSLIKTRMALESGLNYLLCFMETDDDTMVDSKLDVFYDNQLKFKNIKITDNVSFSIMCDDSSKESKVRYGINPVNAQLNLNFLNKEILNKIFEISSVNRDKMVYVMDWIDSDSDSSNNGSGAETDYYSGLDIPYKPSNKPIQSWAELYLIKGMDEEFAKFLKNNFTIFGDGKVNINFAKKETLFWLGFSESLIYKIERHLKGIDEIQGTDDDNIFKNASSIVSELSKEEYLSIDEIIEIQKALPMLTVSSPIYRLNIVSTINDKLYPYKLTSVIERKDKKFQIV